MQGPVSEQGAGLSRAQAVSMLIQGHAPWAQRARWYATHLPPLPLFLDVAQDSAMAPLLETAFEQELIRIEGVFQANAAVNQQEAVVLLVKAEDAKRGLWSDPGERADVTVARARDYGIEIFEPVDPRRPVSVGEFLRMLPQSLGVAPAAAPRSQQQEQNVYLEQVPLEETFEQQPQPPVYAVEQQQPSEPTSIEAQHLQYASSEPFAITIPSLGIRDLRITHPSNPYTEDGQTEVLQYGVGHLFAYPGTNGKVFVYAHSSDWPWKKTPFSEIFSVINQLNSGELLYVTYDGTLYVYQVTAKGEVDNGDVSHYADGGDGEELILYTCWPPRSIAKRYIVRAGLIGSIPL